VVNAAVIPSSATKKNTPSIAVGKSSARVSALGSSTNPVPTNDDGSNRNVYIVNQILPSPEESILPDGVGTSVESALETEIKSEVEDEDIII